MAKLAQDQAKQIEQWASAGATLNDIQNRIREQFGLSLTYLDVRMLLIELGIRLQDKPRPAEGDVSMRVPAQQDVPAEQIGEDGTAFDAPMAEATESAAGRQVSVTVDQLALPGALVSGKATFSDSRTISWFVDQFGRLGMKSPEPGYQPPSEDIAAFQQQLDEVLRRQGF